MPSYMIQASYSAAAVTSMIKTPQDRAAAIRPMVEKLGGKLHGLWFAFGEFDVVVLVDMPDNVSATAIAMAVGGSGAMSAYRTTPLLTSAEATDAMKKAGTLAYAAPQAAR